MIAVMNRSSDSILKARDIEVFEKPRPKKKRVLKKSPSPLRKNRNSKARKKPRRKAKKASR